MQEPLVSDTNPEESISAWGWPSAREWCVIIIGLVICLGVYVTASHNRLQMQQLNQVKALISQATDAATGAALTIRLKNQSPYANQLTADFIEQSQNALTLVLNEQARQSLPQGFGLPSQQQALQHAHQLTNRLLGLLAISSADATADFSHIEQALFELEQQLNDIQRQVEFELSKQFNSFHSLQLALAAILLLVTAAIVMLLRRTDTATRANRYNLERSETSAKRAADQLQHVIDGAELGFYDWDYQSGNVRVNDHWLRSLNLPSSEQDMSIDLFMARVHPDDVQQLQTALQQCLESGQGYDLEYRMQHSKGHWVWFEGSGKAVEMSSEQPQTAARICGTLKDINQRKKAELEYRENERRFRQLIESLPTVAVQGYNKDRDVIYWNDASRHLYGYSKQEALGKKLEQLIIPEPMRDTVIELHHNWVSQGVEIPAAELQLLHKDGHLVPVFSSHVMLKQDSDSPEMFCVDVDLSEQHRAAAELKRLATRDLLTNLPNRRFLEEELVRRLAEASRFAQQLAVLFIDLDLFKEVNDSMGHNAGDHLLQQVAERIKGHLRHYDTLSRFGGDEFIIILPNISGRHEVQAVADKVMAEFERTYRLQQQEVYVTASIGMSIYPDDGKTSVELLKYADAAMYQAKDSGRNQYRFFAASINEQLKRQLNIATYLRQSLERDDFYLVYQPEISVFDHQIFACEALLRWKPEQPDEGAPPSEFIAVAERSDLIIRIGHWVIRSVCRQLAKWRSQGFSTLRVDLNIAAKQLQQPNFFNLLHEALDEYRLHPADIGIELTESAMMNADSKVINELALLGKAGMEITIDDYGSGYCSLNNLKQFPISCLKVDPLLITRALAQADEKAILQAIAQVAAQLQLRLVAEGVETEAQAELCRQLGFNTALGYLYFQPMEAPKLSQLLTPAN